MTKMENFVNEASNLPLPEKGDNTPVKPQDKRVTGKIIKVSEEGYGFISSKDIKFTRIFFHWTSLMQGTLNFTQLKNGMKVEFTPQEVEGKGTRAIKIKVIDSPKVESKPEVKAE